MSYKQKFDYDRFGNLYRKAASNPTSGQATPLPFTPIEDSDISKTTNRFTSGTTYDDAGNVITDTKYRNMNFWYDANGRMFKTTGTNSSNQSNAVYDASGNRVAQQIDGVWRYFIYDIGGKKVAEYSNLQTQSAGGIKYVMQDWQGSTRAITGGNGSVQSRMDYTAFGEEIVANVGMRTTQQGFNASNKLDEKYAKTERDKATGLDHTWFRKLENQGGRWTSPDPYNGSMSLSDPQSFNRYSYVNNQPSNYVDPSGLQLIAFVYTTCEWAPDREHRICSQHIYFMNIGGGGSIGGIDVGGGGGGDPAPQSPPNKPKCRQDKNGENNKAEIEDYLTRAGVSTLIDVSSISVSKEGIVFDFINRAMTVSFLDGSLQVIGPTIFAGQHTDQVGASARDYRGKTGRGELGNKSLQIEVGRKGSAKPSGNNTKSGARGYADLDCDNPAQDVVGFARHATHIVLGGLRNIF